MLSGSHGTATVSLVFGGAAAARVVGALRNRSFGTVRGCGRAGSVDRCHGFSLFDPRRPVIVPEVEPPSARGMTASQPPGLCTGGRIPPYPCGRCRDRRRRPPQPGAGPQGISCRDRTAAECVGVPRADRIRRAGGMPTPPPRLPVHGPCARFTATGQTDSPSVPAGHRELRGHSRGAGPAGQDRLDLRTIHDQRTHPRRSDNMIEFMAITLIARSSPEIRDIRHEE